MIKFYYFDSTPGEMSRPGFRVRGVTGQMSVCQVYSDRNSKELVGWARKQNLARGLMHRHAGLMPHLDLWGEHFGLGGEGVSRDVFVHDIARWDRWPGR